MSFEKFDQEILTPYKSSGDRAREFGEDVIVFTYTQVRYMALMAYKYVLDINRPTNTQMQVGTKPCSHCEHYKHNYYKYSFCPVCGRALSH